MEKLSLLICDTDRLYLERLSRYARNSPAGQPFVVRTAFTREGASAALAGNPADICLLTAAFDDLPELNKRSGLALRLSESDGTESSGTALAKYQPAGQLLRTARERYLDGMAAESGGGPAVAAAGTLVCSFYSAAGGSGKTSIAMQMGRLVSRAGKRVFYLNLESANSVRSRSSEHEPGTFNQALYDLQKDETQWAARFGAWASTLPAWGLDYFPTGIRHALDMFGTTRGTMEELIGRIRRLQRYDVLLVDLESSLHERILGALHASERIYWILPHATVASGRDMQLLKMLNQLLSGNPDSGFVERRTEWLANKVLEVPDRQDWAKDCALLPYVPEWKHVQEVQDAGESEIFQQALQSLLPLQHPGDLGGTGEIALRRA